MTARARRAAIIALHNMTYSSRVFKQADALHAAGFDVTLVGIVARTSDSLQEEHDFGRVIRVRTTKNLHAERQSKPASSGGQPERKGSFLGGVRMFLGRMRDNYLLGKAAATSQCDVVLSSDLTAWAAGYWVKRWLRVPLVLDVRDLVLDSGGAQPSSFRWLMRRLEGFLVHRADLLLTASPCFNDVYAKRYPRAVRATAIYSGSFECAEEAAPAQTPLRFFFQGRFAANRRLDEIVEAVASLDEGVATLSLQGFGSEEASLRALVERLDASDCIEFVDPCDAREVVRCASAYDVGVITHRPDNLNLELLVPIKLIDYMAAGLAVMASDLPAIRDVVDREKCGVLFEPSGSEAIAKAIKDLASDPEAVAEMKANSVRACPKYSAQEQGRQFVEKVESVLAGYESSGGPKS